MSRRLAGPSGAFLQMQPGLGTNQPGLGTKSDGEDEFNRRLENASPADRLIIAGAVITEDEASLCAVMRWMISSALQDDSGDQEALIRYLVAK